MQVFVYMIVYILTHVREKKFDEKRKYFFVKNQKWMFYILEILIFGNAIIRNLETYVL